MVQQASWVSTEKSVPYHVCKGEKVRKSVFLFLLDIELKKTTRSVENNAHVYKLLDLYNFASY